jgi:uncharacterized protein (DUF58 family)
VKIGSRLRERAIAWSRRRHGPDVGTVTLERRRIYIVPTRLGLLFALMLLAMLLGGLNYGNNPALAFTFTLAAVGWVGMHLCHANLQGLTVTYAGASAPFAGDPARFTFLIANPSQTARHDLLLRSVDGQAAAPVSVTAGGHVAVAVEQPTQRRGSVALQRLKLSSTYPLGLCRAWTWLHPEDARCSVYPRPETPGVPPSPLPGDGEQRDLQGAGEDDYAGLRNYRAGDPLRRVAWKAYAKGVGLFVSEYAGAGAEPRLYDWQSCGDLDTEARLARLARWIVDAHASGQAFGLRLPQQLLPLDQGDAHRHRCLEALAAYPHHYQGAANG